MYKIQVSLGQLAFHENWLESAAELDQWNRIGNVQFDVIYMGM
jgi:hypothetical protein